MAKYLLLKHSRGGPAPAVDCAPMDRWTPDEVDAHMRFMRGFATRLEESGEFVDIQALAPDGTFVRYDGEGRPPVTDGPFVETKDLIAGWYIIDVESWDRAVQLAGALLRDLVPAVIGVLVRRGADFTSAEDAMRDAVVEAVRVWPDDPPRDPKGWLVTVAWHKFLDAARADARRAKRILSGVRFDQPGDVATVLRVLYLVFNEGYSGDVDLAAEAIRLTRHLAARINHAEAGGLLALMLLHHARRPARTGPDGQACAPCRAGSRPVAQPSDRRGCPGAPGSPHPRPAGRVSGPSRHRRAPRRRPDGRRDRLGADRRVV